MSLSTFKEKGLLQGDMALWMIFLCLCMISVVEGYSASSSMTYKSGFGPCIEEMLLVRHRSGYQLKFIGFFLHDFAQSQK